MSVSRTKNSRLAIPPCLLDSPVDPGKGIRIAGNRSTRQNAAYMSRGHLVMIDWRSVLPQHLQNGRLVAA